MIDLLLYIMVCNAVKMVVCADVGTKKMKNNNKNIQYFLIIFNLQ